MRLLLLLFFVGLLVAGSYSQIAVVTGDEAFLRGTPAESGAVVDTLVPNSKVQMIKRTGDWFLVQSYPFVGWLHRNSLRAEGSPEPRSDARPQPVPAAARSTAGTPTRQDKPATATPQPSSSKGQRIYTRGPRGGCYYIKPDGKKIYVSHSLCT